MWNIRITRGLSPSIDSKNSILFIWKRQKSRAQEVYRKELTSITRALEHYDDFYSSVYGRKWPSLRLALLTTPKYIAVPNTCAENTAQIATRLEELGAYDVKNMWLKGQELILGKSQAGPLAKDKEAEEVTRLEEMDKTLVSYAQTKVAEELDVLYQNAPERKLPVRATEGVFDDRRVLKGIHEASQEYITPTKLKGMEEFQLESAYFTTYGDPEGEEPKSDGFYKYTNSTNFTKIGFPIFLRPFCFEGGSGASFPASGKNQQSGLRDYLCLNGASLAPIIAMDMQLDVKVLDLCAGPGTKSLLMLMTMCPGLLTCNDLESSRIGRIKRIFKEFLGGSDPSHVNYTKCSGANYGINQTNGIVYDRVLCDVPCTSDRISLTVQENNLFKSTRAKERLGIVQLQKSILMSGFSALASDPGSACVYSTCTLSPIENDGVVAAALKEHERQDLVVDLMGLWQALAPFQAARLFQLSRTRFGVLIEPNVVSNFGPMYISRIVVSPKPSLKS